MTKSGLVSAPRLSKYDLAVMILASNAPAEVKDRVMEGLSAQDLYRIIVIHRGSTPAYSVLYFVGRLVRAHRLQMPTRSVPVTPITACLWSDSVGDTIDVDQVWTTLNTEALTAILRHWADGDITYQAAPHSLRPEGEVPSLFELCMGHRDFRPRREGP